MRTDLADLLPGLMPAVFGELTETLARPLVSTDLEVTEVFRLAGLVTFEAGFLALALAPLTTALGDDLVAAELLLFAGSILADFAEADLALLTFLVLRNGAEAVFDFVPPADVLRLIVFILGMSDDRLGVTSHP